MIKIAIIDDEKEVRDFLFFLIQRQEIDAELWLFSSAENFLKENQEFDLLFLDIALSIGDGRFLKERKTFHQLEISQNIENPKMTGLDLAKCIRNNDRRQPIIIFVTGYENYVFEAFDVEAFHYLLKPIQEEKLKQVLHRAVGKIKKKKEPIIELSFAGVSRKLIASEIYYIESFNHKICVHTKTQSMESYARIGELEEVLKDSFFRIHKGYLINLAYVDSYSRTEVKLTNGASLFLSKYKYHDFTKAYLQYLAERQI